MNKKEKEEVVSAERFLTSYEKERVKREREFDERIKKMKEELANQTSDKHPSKHLSGTPAEELHPNVKNIPHHLIRISDEKLLPDVEITE